jgi:hypothetical protein
VVVAVFLGFLAKLSQLGLNFSLYAKINKGASVIFFLNVFLIIALLGWFWVRGNIITTVQALAPLGIVFLFTAKSFFKAHAVAKEE